MKHTLLLTRVMFKHTLQTSMNKSFGKRTKKWVSVLLGLFLVVYLGGAIGTVSGLLIDTFNDFNQLGFLFLLMFALMSIMIVFISLFSLPSLLYFAKDTDRYIVLPVSMRSILSAKLITSYLSTLLLTFIFTIPFGIAYIVVANPSILSILFYVFAIVIAPIIPLFIAVILTVAAFRFIPFVKNKEMFTYFSTAFALIVSLVIIFGSSSSSFSNIEAVIASLQNGDGQLVSIIGIFVPSAQWLAISIQDSNILYTLLTLGVSLIVAYLSVLVLQAPYAHAVVNVNEKGGRKRKVSDSQNYADSTKKTLLRSLVEYDLRNIFRSPTFMMNYFAPLIIVPISLFIPIMSGISYSQLLDLAFGFTDILNSIPVLTMIIGVVGIGFLVSFFFSSFTTLTSTALSREGQSLLSLKSMPIDLMDIIHSKILLGTLIMGIIPVMIGLALLIMIRFNVIYVILFIVGGLAGTLCGNILSILPDVYSPKLVWESEQEAVKQNFMAIIPMFGIMTFVGIIVFIMINVGFTVGIPLGLVLILLLSFIAYTAIKKLSETRLPDIINKQ